MAGFRSLVSGLIKQAFVIIDDLADVVVYTSITDSAYDPSTGTSTDTSTNYTFNGVITRFGANDTDSNVVVSTDAKLLLSAVDMPAVPNENDTLTAKGKTWKVVRTLGVPGDGFWKIHIREV